MSIVIWILSLLPIAATLLPVIRSGRSWIRVWDYPRLQLAILLAIAAAVQLAAFSSTTARLLLLGGTAGCLAWQVWRIYPYTPLAGFQVRPARKDDPANTVGVLIANVLQTNREAPRLLERVAAIDPDVVLALETDAWWDAQIAPLAERYPHNVRHPLENTYGMHLFSRLELRGVTLQYRVEPGIPSIAARLRLRSGAEVDLHCLHPEPPVPGVDADERDAELLLVGREVAASGRPAIVCGDLNDVAWSRTTRLFQRISRLLDPRVGRGLFATFHADYWFARWPLDHLFHDASFALCRLELLDPIGSDHFPIYVRLLHDPSAAARHEAPRADQDDHREADERIAEGTE